MFRSWRQLFRRHRRPKPQSRPKPRSRPVLEVLEDRLAPATFNVALGGNDGNAGDPTAPFRTIQRALLAVDQALDGNDIIRVEGGTYSDPSLDFSLDIFNSTNITNLRLLGGFLPGSSFTQRAPRTTVYVPQSPGGVGAADVFVEDANVTIDGFTFVFDGTPGPGGDRTSAGVIAFNKGLTLFNNLLEAPSSSGPGANDAFAVQAGFPFSGVDVAGLTLLGNDIQTDAVNASGGVLLPTFLNSGTILLQSNTITGTTLSQAVVADSLSNVILRQNTIQDNGSVGSGLPLVFVSSVNGFGNFNNILIDQNTIIGNSLAGSTGVSVSAPNSFADDIRLTNNDVSGFGTGVNLGPNVFVARVSGGSIANTGTGITANGVFSQLELADIAFASNTNDGVIADSFTQYIVSSGTQTFNGTFTGSTTLTKLGAGTLTLIRANDYTGFTNVFDGTLSVGSAANIIPDNSDVQSFATFDLNGQTETIGSLSGSGTVVLGGGVVPAGTLLTGNNNSSTTFNGLFTGSGTVVKVGTGTFTLTGSNAFTGQMRIDAGTLLVNGSQPTVPILVNNATATLGGTGTTGPVTASAGTLNPGISGPGTFNVSGNATFAPAATFLVELTGTSSGQADLLSVSNTASLNGANLSVALNFNSAVGDTFTILQAGLVTGTFAQDGSILVNGQRFQITYGSSTVTLTHLNTGPSNLTLSATPNPANEGDTVTLSGSFSDPDLLDSHTVTINWGDGTTDTLNLSSGTLTFSTTHPYTDNLPLGSVITVTVADSQTPPLTTTATTPITVNNVDPTASLNNSGPVNEGSTATVTFFNQFDPGTQDTAVGFTYSYDFNNDGDFTDPGELSGVALPTATVPASFLDDGPGTRTVRGRISDKDGGGSDVFTTITIFNVQPTPTINGCPPTSVEGTSITLNATATDPSTADTSAGFVFNWFVNKDGQFFASGSGPSFTFTPDDDGNYIVFLQATDKDGDTGFDSCALTVTNAAPLNVTVSVVPTTINEGQSVNVSGSFTDAGSADTHTVVVDFGDGTSTTLFLAAGVTTFGPVPHTYTDNLPGNAPYTISALVTDNNGASAIGNTQVTVNNVVPTATLGNNGPVGESGTATVTFSNQLDPGLQDSAVGFLYSYDFNSDGLFEITNSASPSADVPALFLADGPATLTVSAVIADKDGGSTLLTTTLNINNVSPTPMINGAPASSPEGTPITLTASASDPSTSDTVAGFTFAWTVLKNGNPFSTGTGASFTFTPDDNGNYAVTLSATDKDGGTGTTTRTIGVTNVVPTPVIGGGPVGGASLEGTAINLTATATDPSGPDTTAGFTLAWSVTKNGNPFASSAGAAFSFTPDDNGVYIATLTATDKDGGAGVTTRAFAVQNVAPTNFVVGPTPGALNEGSVLNLLGSFTDPGTGDTHTVVIEWGDGTPQTVLNLAANVTTFTASHLYADDNPSGTPTDTNSVVILVTDKDAASAPAVIRTVQVNNVPPALTPPNVSSPILVGGTVTLTGGIVDPGTLDTFNLTVNWGDGTVQTFPLPAGTTTYQFMHTYTAALASAAVQVTITDDDSGAPPTSTSTGTGVTVNPNFLDFGDAINRYVRALYADVLRRTADIAGFNHWGTLLATGRLTRAQVATEFFISPERFGLVVDRFYAEILGRPAEAAGRAHWVAMLRQGLAESDVVIRFLTSPEFTATHLSNASYIDALYRILLNRAPAPAEILLHLSSLNNGSKTRAQLALDFLASDEALFNAIDDYYRTYLRRQDTPFERQLWFQAIIDGRVSPVGVQVAFLASEEYFQLVQRIEVVPA